MSSFLNIQHELISQGFDQHASELHGRLVGYLCAVKEQSSQHRRDALYRDWLDGEPAGELKVLLEAAYKNTVDNLGEYSDFDFNLLIPADDQPIGERAMAVSLWCSGFLSGFGESGRTLEHGSDVAEAMTDLGRIAAMTEEVPEGEENEADLVEIIEFVRISALLVFADGSEQGAPQRPGGTH